MTIFVGELFTATPRTKQAQRFGNQWCHMTSDADNIEELHLFAAKLGLRRQYFQGDKPWFQHYDLIASKRAQAVKLGAVEITWREEAEMSNKRREKLAEMTRASLTQNALPGFQDHAEINGSD